MFIAIASNRDMLFVSPVASRRKTFPRPPKVNLLKNQVLVHKSLCSEERLVDGIHAKLVHPHGVSGLLYSSLWSSQWNYAVTNWRGLVEVSLFSSSYFLDMRRLR